MKRMYGYPDRLIGVPELKELLGDCNLDFARSLLQAGIIERRKKETA